METEEVERHYALLPTHKLSRLAQRPEALPTVFVLVLQRELLARGEESDALGLSTYLTESKKKGEKPTEKSLRERIKAGIVRGYSLHDILLKLREANTHVYYAVSINTRLSEFIFNRMRSMKKKGAAFIDMVETFQEEYGITAEEMRNLVLRLKNRGKLNLVAGFSLIFIVIAVFTVTSLLGDKAMMWHAVLLPIGFWRIYEGYQILRSV